MGNDGPVIHMKSHADAFFLNHIVEQYWLDTLGGKRVRGWDRVAVQARIESIRESLREMNLGWVSIDEMRGEIRGLGDHDE